MITRLPASDCSTNFITDYRLSLSTTYLQYLHSLTSLLHGQEQVEENCQEKICVISIVKQWHSCVDMASGYGRAGDQTAALISLKITTRQPSVSPQPDPDPDYTEPCSNFISIIFCTGQPLATGVFRRCRMLPD